MRSIESFIPRRGLAIAGLALGSLSLAGCSNYSGEGNDFVVTGQVEDTTWQSITARVINIDRAEGDALDDMWFLDTGQTEEFHDNCDCDDSGLFVDRITIGTLYEGGQEISPEALSIGQCVEFQGKIRTDNDGKTSHERPVYERADVVPCG